MQGKTCEDTLTAVENNVTSADWTKNGSIWNYQENVTTKGKCRATTCQLAQLVEFMERRRELVGSAASLPISERLWGKLTAHINQFGPPKTPRQCKTTWRDLRKRAFAVVRNMKNGRNKRPGRTLYGMVPRILRLVAASGGLPGDVQAIAEANGGLENFIKSLLSVSLESSGSQVSTSEAATVDPLPDSTPQLKPIKVEKTSTGDQLIIRVTDKLDAKTNVLNRFSVRDGHFENNVIVKEEEVEVQQEMDESSENMETEGDGQEFQEEFPAAEAILGDSSHQGERDSLLQELNKTLNKFVAEYSERTQLMRERLELERARLQFDMQVFQAQQKKNS